MQFQYNSDYPGLDEQGTFLGSEARGPDQFPPAQPLPCARITTRVFHPGRRQVATVQNVLVRTTPPRPRRKTSGDDDSSSSGFMSSSSSSEGNDQMEDTDASPLQQDDRAYWVQRTVREAIYGNVLMAVVLRKRRSTPDVNAEWEVTEQRCAVKEMSWQHIRKERDHLAEDPIQEVAAMQYLKRWRDFTRLQQPSASLTDSVAESFRTILETNIMMPLDLLSDDRHLYSIMPYCDGGELFERLDMNEKFTEDEARYWMLQILNGLENLQHAGICHRDMSLENLLVHETGALIIDMGMCLRVPIADSTNDSLSRSMQNMTMNGVAGIPSVVGGPLVPNTDAVRISARNERRYMIQPQGTCGKWIYMSPEVYKSKEPFDGYAVDMWAAGVILFLMITGFPPWERACMTDERFKYMTAGYLVQMLTEWELGISSDAMDLLQRMLFLDPKDRLSLDQVRAHPWMTAAVPVPISSAQQSG